MLPKKIVLKIRSSHYYCVKELVYFSIVMKVYNGNIPLHAFVHVGIIVIYEIKQVSNQCCYHIYSFKYSGCVYNIYVFTKEYITPISQSNCHNTSSA